MINDLEPLDWERERQAEELRVEAFERRVYKATSRPRYHRENTGADFLAEIVAENVKASNERYQYGNN
jgi:hypothetical protein